MNQFEVLFQQLAMAAHANLPLRDVFRILRNEGRYPGTLPATVGQRLERGGALSEALSSAGAAFPPETVEFVRAAEGTAMLAAALEGLALDYSRRAAGRRAVLKAMYWPAALAFALVLLLALAMVFVMPAFKAVYADFGADLPPATLLLVSVSDFVLSYWPWTVLFAVMSAIGLYLLNRRTALWVPLIQPFSTKLFQLRVSAMLALAAGAEARFATAAIAHLGATAPTAGSGRWIEALRRRLAAGTEFLRAIGETEQLPSRVVAMLELGSRTGNMAGARAYIESWCDAEFDEALPKFETNVLIATYVLVGLALGFIVIALYLPIFRLSAAV